MDNPIQEQPDHLSTVIRQKLAAAGPDLVRLAADDLDDAKAKDAAAKVESYLERLNVYRQSNPDELELASASEIVHLSDFKKGARFTACRDQAIDLLLKGSYVPQFIFAGAATRLNRGPMYSLDIWELAEELGKGSGGSFRLGMGPRQIIAYRSKLESLAKAKGIDTARVLRVQKFIINVNSDIDAMVRDDFRMNNFYGFDPANIYFILQPTFPGYRLDAGGVTPDSASPRLPYGHGYNVMQLRDKNQAYRLSAGGEIDPLTEDILTQLDPQSFIGTHRINDLTKFSSAEVIDPDKLAFGIFQHQNGFNIVAELVENPDKQKGGNAVKDSKSGKTMLLETSNAKGHPHLVALLDRASKEGAPYNAFRLLYQVRTLKELLKNDLPYNVRFKSGFFYLEAVTGDLTQSPSARTSFFTAGEVIHDFKEPKNIDDALRYLAIQEKELKGGAIPAIRPVHVASKDMAVKIAFGTSGWRAKLGETMDSGDYNLANVGRLAQGIAHSIQGSIRRKGVLIAYDAREGGDRFALRFAQVLKANGIPVAMGQGITTTPSVIAMTRESLGSDGYDLAFHITASHNDTTWQGVKVFQNGVVASDDLTNGIFAKTAARVSYFLIQDAQPGKEIEVVDVAIKTVERYRKSFPGLIDNVRSYLKQNPRVSMTLDVMHGAFTALTAPFEEMGIKIVRREPMKDRPYPQGNVFNEDGEMKGYRPEPKRIFLSQKDFNDFEQDAHPGSIYMAIDGDSDRLAIWYKSGPRDVRELDPNSLGVVYTWYLLKSGKTDGRTVIAKTQPTTFGMNAVAAWANRSNPGTYKLVVTPVGSKYFGEYAVDSAVQKILIGTEESGHQVLKSFFDDAGSQALQILEIMTETKKSIVENIEQAGAEIGFKGVYKRVNANLTPEIKTKIVTPLKSNPRSLADTIAGLVGKPIQIVSMTSSQGRTVTLDQIEKADSTLTIKENEGIHVQFTDGSWAMIRLSGTEPVARLYIESFNEEDRMKMQKAILAEIFGVY